MHPKLAQSILQQVKENYNCCAEEFSRTRTYNWSDISVLADKYVNSGMKILDVGCGNGRFLQLLRDKDADYTGIDNSEAFIKEAKKKQELRMGRETTNARTAFTENTACEESEQSLSIQNVKFTRGDILNLPFNDNEFDAALCIAVLHHIPSKELRKKAMSEIYRVLKPNGILIMSNWNLWQDKYRKFIYKFSIEKIFNTDARRCEHRYARIGGMDFGDIMLKPFSGRGSERYHHAFTEWGIKKIFKKSGFEVVENYYTSGEKKAGWRDGKNLICVGRK